MTDEELDRRIAILMEKIAEDAVIYGVGAWIRRERKWWNPMRLFRGPTYAKRVPVANMYRRG
jgi:hypothetical protein